MQRLKLKFHLKTSSRCKCKQPGNQLIIVVQYITIRVELYLGLLLTITLPKSFTTFSVTIQLSADNSLYCKCKQPDNQLIIREWPFDIYGGPEDLAKMFAFYILLKKKCFCPVIYKKSSMIASLECQKKSLLRR